MTDPTDQTPPDQTSPDQSPRDQTPADQSAIDQILAFARHIGRSSETAPDSTPQSRAQRRDWLDADGKPTKAGMELLAALDDQGTTRTVFRGNF